MLHISIAAEKLAEVVGIQITNSLLYTLVIFLVLVNFAFLVKFQINIIPSKLQSIAEMGVNMVYELVESIAGAYTREFFPWVMTFFIFILVSNWLGLVPGLSAIGVKEVVEGKEVIVPFFRAVTADLNTTLALGLISVGMSVYFGFTTLGFGNYVSKFINFHSPIDFLVGLLEIFLEFAKIISFAFRLFGNIFAGEVLLTVMGSLVPLFLPIPFLALEIFVGFIQALVFAVLTAVFFRLAVEKAH